MDPAVWNGATQGEWGLEVGTDGSGFDSDVPEMMQRGWAVVQLDQQGWPHTSEAREFAKGDPDSGQGRAACSIAGDKNDPHLEHHRRRREGLADEGGEWDERVTAANRIHATMWGGSLQRRATREHRKFSSGDLPT